MLKEKLTLSAIERFAVRYPHYTITPNYIWDAVMTELAELRASAARQENADIVEPC